MTDVAQSTLGLVPGNILAVRKYQGLTLEPPTKDIIEIGSDGDVDAVTKEEEWIKKKKTELTTTRQIETRVKRQVVLEDGKVVEDSGPIVSTNTTEDTEKQESETNERRNLGDQDQIDGPNAKAIEGDGVGISKETTVTRPDGLVREVKEKKVVSREEIDELLETEDVKYLGDFSDEAYVKAVNSGIDNIQSVLLSSDVQKQLIPIGPRIVNQTSKTKKTIDTEDTDLKCLAQPDGTLITEKKKTTEHEVLIDEDLPEADDNSTGSREKIVNKESSQRFFKQRDEQNVEYVANGKIIGKEMRYAAETETMERDGAPENPSDWDSLSDRVRKARRAQKTLLQQQKAAEAILGERKDALTKRPLDFDKEEETRKTETSKWLESHFGSESRSSKDSRDDDIIEPTKKTYFNVTIKSSTNVTPATTPTRPTISPINDFPTKLNAPSKVFVTEREKPKATFFQGVSDWSERKESTPKNFISKSFQEELKNTLEKKHRLIKQSAVAASREDLRHARPVKETIVKREEVKFQKSTNNGNKPGFRRDSRDDSDDSRNIRILKEDPGYISGSKNDLRFRKDSREELDRFPKNKRENGYLHREDSGYVKDSREDLRYVRNGREDSFIREQVEMDRSRDDGRLRQNSIQRDDSAYVSSSTYLTSPRSPKTQRSPQIRTPDSGIRSPTPDDNNLDESRPTVPQRKRALERKVNLIENGYITSQMREEPPPDYSPPPRSRSISPMQQHIIHQQKLQQQHQQHQQKQLQNGNTKKQYQKTRFESETRPAATQTSPHKPNKVGSVIGNSIRKLVGKIRSASAERKLKIKTKRSPSPHKNNNNNNHNNNNNSTNQSQINGSSTYQQYNVIDGHIGQQQQQQLQQQQQQHHHQQQQHHIGIGTRETSVSSSGRRERTLDRRGSSDIDMASPKQRYYLGEDPYGGSIFGKENKYDGVRTQRINSRRHKTAEQQEIYSPSRTTLLSSGHHVNSSTLGRFSKSTNRLTSTQSADPDMYRSVQTLPRKLDHNKKGTHSSTINVSIVNTVQGGQNINTGPAKPARTYKSLNRSKSFNVHGLNGTANPSPIYMSKLTRNYSNSAYKSNPHLNESAQQLKSPSIVNLVSRSQRDLTKIEPKDDERKYNGYLGDRRYIHNNNNINGINNNNNNNNYGNGLSPDKRTMFLKGLQDQAPELYKTLHGDEEIIKNGYAYKYNIDRNGNRERESSLGSRSPITINKDTASIIRRGSSSTDDYNESYKITTKSDDPNRPSITNTVKSFTKKTIPSKDGRAKETIESSETKTVTTSRYRGEPMSNLRYKEIERARRDSGPVIEVRNNNNSRRN